MQNHPSPENIQHSSSTHSRASSSLSHQPPFSEQLSATRELHTTENCLFRSTNNLDLFIHHYKYFITQLYLNFTIIINPRENTECLNFYAKTKVWYK